MPREKRKTGQVLHFRAPFRGPKLSFPPQTSPPRSLKKGAGRDIYLCFYAKNRGRSLPLRGVVAVSAPLPFKRRDEASIHSHQRMKLSTIAVSGTRERSTLFVFSFHQPGRSFDLAIEKSALISSTTTTICALSGSTRMILYALRSSPNVERQ